MSDAPMACPSDRQTDQDGGREANRNQARTCQPQRLAQPTTSRPRRCTQNTRTAQHDTRESSRITRITNNQRSSSILLSRRNASERQPDSQTARQPDRRERQATRLACLGFFFFFCIIFIFIFFFFSLSLSRLSRPKIQRSCNRECPDTQPPTRDSLTLTSMSCPDAV